MRVVALVLALVAPGPLAAQGAVLYATDFTDAAGWSVVTGCAPGYAWRVDALPADHPFGPYRSAPTSLNFNDDFDIGGAPGSSPPPVRTCGSAISPPLDLSLLAGEARLRLWLSFEVEGSSCLYDALTLRVRPAGGGPAFIGHCLTLIGESDWRQVEVPLQPAWGPVEVELHFDTIDSNFNGFRGPFVDDLEVSGTSFAPRVLCAGAPNSVAPEGARLEWTGTTSVERADLVLQARGLPPAAPALLLLGRERALQPFAAGWLCLARPVAVLPPASADGGGALDLAIPADSAPFAGRILPGDTWILQVVYRDPGSTPPSSNASQALVTRWSR